jgi:hypothetical protein
MGQQQLLLIVLGVIVVGIAVVVGINLFNANAIASNKDAVASDLTNLGAMAQQYYKKPASMGGGANKFDGWLIPTGLDSTANGTYSCASPAGQSITISAIGTENGANGSKITAHATVTPTNISVTMDNQ